jgi:mannose-1-phosphate guanylyltransferase / phosphomannomutase
VISDTINTGIYVLEPEIFNYIPEGENFDFSQDLFPLMLQNNDPLFGFSAKGYWRDIGNTDSYREAYHDIFKGKVNLKIDEEKQDFVGKDLRVGADVTLEDARVCPARWWSVTTPRSARSPDQGFCNRPQLHH